MDDRARQLCFLAPDHGSLSFSSDRLPQRVILLFMYLWPRLIDNLGAGPCSLNYIIRPEASKGLVPDPMPLSRAEIRRIRRGVLTELCAYSQSDVSRASDASSILPPARSADSSRSTRRPLQSLWQAWFFSHFWQSLTVSGLLSARLSPRSPSNNTALGLYSVTSDHCGMERPRSALWCSCRAYRPQDRPARLVLLRDELRHRPLLSQTLQRTGIIHFSYRIPTP